jgi:hypothetical protein
MFSFGASRHAYDRVYYKERIPADRAIPGPGTYELDTSIGKNSRKFTLTGRIACECKSSNSVNFTLAFIAVKSKTPGPGHYDLKRVNSEGRTVLSTDPSSRVP